MPRAPLTIAATLLAAAALAGCGSDDDSGSGAESPKTIVVKSPVLKEGAVMPAPFTCDGVDVSPPVAWIKLPQGTKSVALTMEDPDASGGDFVHWSLYNIPPIGVGIAAGQLPLGARQGRNSFGKEGHGGPCPPKGDDAHHYVITVYGLRQPIPIDVGTPPAKVRAEIARLALARGTLTTLYGR